MNRKYNPLLVILLIAMIILMLMSCEDNNTNQTGNESEVKELSDSKSVTVYTYDGCEYVVAGYGKYQWGTHKGNCNNPIHKK